MKYSVLYCILVILLCACTSDFLSEKPIQSQVVPTSLKDFQALLDNDRELNGASNVNRGPIPGIGEAGSDDYYVTDDVYNSKLLQQMQNYYTWNKEIYAGYPPYEWSYPYQAVFYANLVLDGLKKLTAFPEPEYYQIQAEAHFHRAHAYYQLAQVFVPPFDISNSNLKLGLPLRQSSDINEVLHRSSIKETYSQIIKDLNVCVKYLPNAPVVKTRPSKSAAYALLARTYLSMRDYPNALRYADSTLMINDYLIDYNDLNQNANYPFPAGSNNNPEVLFCGSLILRPSDTPFRSAYAFVDTSLYNSYSVDDLRLSTFYTKNGSGYRFKGSYDGNDFFFAGLATNEIYFIKAECEARIGTIDSAVSIINYILKKRFNNKKPFKPIDAKTRESLVNNILDERRKELVFRGLRWTDLRRLNLEGRKITLKRIVKGTLYELYPNDPRYTYAIPPEIMAYHPTWLQNER